MKEKNYKSIKKEIKEYRERTGINPFISKEITESEEMERKKMEDNYGS